MAAALKEGQHVAAFELTTEHDIALRIDAMNLKHRLRDIETDCRDRLHDCLLRIGAPNSTHFYDTHVPVEEPSTASKADSCTAAKSPSFDHCVGLCEQAYRQNEDVMTFHRAPISDSL